MKSIQKQQLVAVAEELNEQFGLQPPIPTTGKAATKDSLIKAIRKAGAMAEPEDQFSAETLNILTVLGVDLTKEPEPQKDSPKSKPKTKKDDKPISGCKYVMQLVCQNPEITKDQIRAKLDKGGYSISDSSITTAIADTRKVVNYMVEIGKATY